MKPSKLQFAYWESLNLEQECEFKAVRAGGKGGQNVNKVSTKVELYWKIQDSNILTPEEKLIISAKLSGKISTEGFLKLTSEETRSQLENRRIVISKLYSLLVSCFQEDKPRKATKPTKTAVNERLKKKNIAKIIKENRKKPEW